jgi:N-acetylglucosamine kinase-like BadF-type ATPase
MVEYMLEARDRSEIASLAKLVDDEATKGDCIANQILEDAADDIAETVRCVVESLRLAEEALPLIGTGSVTVRSSTYWSRTCERVAGFAPRFEPVLADRPPALGLVLGMASQLGLASQEFRQRLLGSEL